MPHPSPDPAPYWFPFRDGVRRFVARRVPPPDVDDVVQDVLLRLLTSPPPASAEAHVERWIFGIARRTVADFYRRRGARDGGTTQRLTPHLADEAGATEGSPSPTTGTDEVHEEVLSWLRPTAEALPPRYARPLVWADFEGVPQAEIADRLGLSLSGAKSRVQRARRMLADRLRACCEVDFGADGRAEAYHRLEGPRSCENGDEAC